MSLRYLRAAPTQHATTTNNALPLLQPASKRSQLSPTSYYQLYTTNSILLLLLLLSTYLLLSTTYYLLPIIIITYLLPTYYFLFFLPYLLPPKIFSILLPTTITTHSYLLLPLPTYLSSFLSLRSFTTRRPTYYS